MCPSARILYCHCTCTDLVPGTVREKVLAGLSTAGVEYEMVPDLCELAAQHDPVLLELAGGDNVKIVACFPRAVRCLFNAAGVELAEDKVEILNMRTESPDRILQAVLENGQAGRDSK